MSELFKKKTPRAVMNGEINYRDQNRLFLQQAVDILEPASCGHSQNCSFFLHSCIGFIFLPRRVATWLKTKKVMIRLWFPYCAASLNCCTNDETQWRQSPTAIGVPFIKMEGEGKCSRDSNWWVKHLSPEELYPRLRATVVNFNYHSHTRATI